MLASLLLISPTNVYLNFNLILTTFQSCLLFLRVHSFSFIYLFRQPVAAPTPEPTVSPTVYLEPGSKAILLKIQITGVTKRAGGWKANMEEALKPVVAKALDINEKFLTFTNNQRRYTDGEIWVDFTVPNDDFDFKEEVNYCCFLSLMLVFLPSCNHTHKTIQLLPSASFP